MALDTLANVKTRLGITTAADDALLGLLQSSADQAVAEYCGRDFGGGTFTEYHPGGVEFLVLACYPVASVVSVKVDAARQFGPETVLPAHAYVVHAERGVIQSVGGPFLPQVRAGLSAGQIRDWTSGARVVQVVYSTASGAVPDDVKEAYARLIGHWYRQVKTDAGRGWQNVAQQKYGETFVIYGSERLGWPDEVERLLSLYRTPPV